MQVISNLLYYLGKGIKKPQERSGKMKRSFLSIAGGIISLFVLFGFSWAQCPEDTIDMGICDTFYVEAWAHTDTCWGGNCGLWKINNPGSHFPCFLYVNLFVTHDSTTFWWQGCNGGAGCWTQDSIAGFVVPLKFWHQPVSGMDADSVKFPTASNFNNTRQDPEHTLAPRSVFRHFIDSRTGDTLYYNRIAQTVGPPDYWTQWSVTFSLEDTYASPGDSGLLGIADFPQDGSYAWDEGSKELLHTYTFIVYMEEGETTEVCFDTSSYGPGNVNKLEFTRIDAKNYKPRPIMPLCFKVYGDTVEVSPLKLPPVVSDIPDQSIPEGGSFTPINLDAYVDDPDNSDDQMTWSYWGNVELLVDITNRIATVTAPDPEWSGSETIWFKACDPGGLCDSNEASFTITAVNDTPVVSDIPDQSIPEGGSFTPISLDDYVDDPDNSDAQMTWSYWGNVELLVDVTDRIATITAPDPEWNGSETIWFKACDPGGLCDSNEAVFTVTAVNDTPVVSDIPDQTILVGESFTSISLDDYVNDPDNTDEEMTWTYSGNIELLVDITDRVATITVPNPSWSGSESIWFKACDPGGLCDSNEATFTVLVTDFAIDVVPDTLKIPRGYSGDYTVILTGIGGFASPCTLMVDGLPGGSTATFEDSVLVPTDTTLLTIAIPNTATLDTLPLIITATELNKGKVISHSDTVTLILTLPTWYFEVDAFPDTQSVTPGKDTIFNVIIIPQEGWGSPCTLSVSNLPPAATGMFDDSVIEYPYTDTSILTITTDPTTPEDVYTLTIQARFIRWKHSDQVTLIVQRETDVQDEGDQLNVPEKFALFQNQPNPFNPETNISYYLSEACEVKLTIYDILGRKVKTLFEGYQTSGMKTSVWDGRDDQGQQLGSGVYFYRLQAGEFKQTLKMTLIK
jgi:hypothetical protein